MAKITKKMVDLVIEEIGEGVTLRQLSRIHGFSKSAWYRLLEADEEIAGRFACARARGFDAIAEEAIEIADDGTNDWETREREDGSTYEALNHEHVQRSKVRIETRLKLLAKWDPKRYGDAMTHKHADANGDKLPALDDVSRSARLAAIAAHHNSQLETGDDAVD